jgi:diguanylate cyclase (GGDEF)-like protein
MNTGRLTKALQRRLIISWREQPGQSDIEALEANVERVGLVIRLRWAIVAALAIFSVLATIIYAVDGQIAALPRQMLIPAGSLGFVLVYNYYYQRNYRRFGNLTVFNAVQLLLDIAVVTLLVYYSGGVYSWFHAMYFLFVLEAALILESRNQVWFIALAAAVAYVAVVGAVYLRIVPHMPMPFVSNDLQLAGAYVAVRTLWTLTVIFGSATVGTLFMSETQGRVERLLALAVRDQRTGLYDRAFLRRELAVEMERAKRFDRGVSVALADIDGFEHFNDLFGVEAGNRMIVLVADAVREVTGCDGVEPCLVIASRYGGEEFALLVPEDANEGALGAVALGERLRTVVGQIRDDDRSVTVSVGVASYPADGRTTSELLGAADAALARAYALGGNSVVVGRVAAEET